MKSLLILVAAFLAVLAPAGASAAATLIKGSTPAVYYIDEGKRWVFPNEKVYFSWYQGFDGVETVSDETLASYPIGGNVTYKPGLKLVKLQSDPRVYAVGAGGRLRWIASEKAAIDLYGREWNRQVDDIPDSFFFTYKEGEPIASQADFDVNEESRLGTISDDISLRSGGAVSKEFSAKRSGVWSDPQVWGGSRPDTGSRVIIPAGVKVVYDLESSPGLKTLDVFGALEFSVDKSTKLSARQIGVRGSLTIGSAESPLSADKKAEIFLTGSASTAVGDDGLTIDGGTLSIHGASVGQGWSALSIPAKRGEAKITLDAPVAWPIGSEIAILGATSEDLHETRTIKAVNGAVLTLDAPLSSTHRSEPGLRSEVVSLDRNVVIGGVGGGFGGYVRGINRARVHIDDVEFENLGRQGAFGQYPVFFDGLEAPSMSSSVIKKSGNRCLVLRQTDNAVIDANAAFSIYGHCFATEDGTETGNVFSRNLAADLRPGASSVDAAPAGFLMRHPGNFLRDNSVVASAGFGYWYDLPENAARNSGVKLKPREAKLEAFEKNSVRGVKKTGLYVDDEKGSMNYAPSETAVFSGLTAIMNGARGFWIRGAGVEVRGAYLAENSIGGTFAAFGATLKDSIIEGRLSGSAKSTEARYGFTYSEGPVNLQDIAFRRFDGESAALSFESQGSHLPDPRNSQRRITYVDSRQWKISDDAASVDSMSVVRDLDAGDSIVSGSEFLGVCEEDDASGAKRCPDAYAQLVVALREGSSDKDVTFTNLVSGGSVTLKPGAAFDGDYAYANVAEGGAYSVSIPNVPAVRVEYDGLVKPIQLRLTASHGAAVRSGGAAAVKKELEELAPGTWGYDATKGEVILWLNPGDSFDVTR